MTLQHEEGTTSTDLGQFLMQIYQVEEMLGNTEELKELKRKALLSGGNISSELIGELEFLKDVADPVKVKAETLEGLREILEKDTEVMNKMREVDQMTPLLFCSDIDLDMERWGYNIKQWHHHCSSKPFFRAILKVVTEKRLNDNNFKVIKAISSAYTHLAIEAELDEEALEFFEVVGQSLIRCSTVLHNKQEQLYPLVIMFLSRLFIQGE